MKKWMIHNVKRTYINQLLISIISIIHPDNISIKYQSHDPTVVSAWNRNERRTVQLLPWVCYLMTLPVLRLCSVDDRINECESVGGRRIFSHICNKNNMRFSWQWRFVVFWIITPYNLLLALFLELAIPNRMHSWIGCVHWDKDNRMCGGYSRPPSLAQCNCNHYPDTYYYTFHVQPTGVV
jgi:hypothetical protein